MNDDATNNPANRSATDPTASDPTTVDRVSDGLARLAMVTVDCDDPVAEAEFWSALTGEPIAVATPEYSMIVGRGPALGFGRVEDYRAPAWPNPGGSKQFHLDLAVDDIPLAEERALALGATPADPQPGATWRVLLDPAGHPFCLTDASNWS